MDEQIQTVVDMLIERIGKENLLREWFSIRQAADYAGVSQKLIYGAVKRGEIRCANIGGDKRPTYRIARKDMSEWMEAHFVKISVASERDKLVEKYFPKRRRPSA